MLIGNKVDQDHEREVSYETGKKLAGNFIEYNNNNNNKYYYILISYIYIYIYIFFFFLNKFIYLE